MKRGHRLLKTVLIAALLAGSTAGQPGDDAEAASFRIASWNMYFLSPTQPPAKKSDKRTIKDLAERVTATGAAILALQEIGGTANDVTGRSGTLDAVFKLLAESKNDWDYRLFPDDKRDGQQMTGVAWNKKAGVDLVKGPLALDVGPWDEDEGYWGRRPYATQFRLAGRSDIVVVSVHMKSNVQDGDSDPEAIREEEARLLLDAIATLKPEFGTKERPELDFVIIGDFNTKEPKEPCLRLLRKAGYWDFNYDGDDNFAGGGLQPFDHVLAPKGQPEFPLGQDVVVHRLAGVEGHDFKRRFSDHFPISIEVRATADDDG